MRRLLALFVLLPVVYVTMLTSFALPTSPASAVMAPHPTTTSLILRLGGFNAAPVPC